MEVSHIDNSDFVDLDGNIADESPRLSDRWIVWEIISTPENAYCPVKRVGFSTIIGLLSVHRYIFSTLNKNVIIMRDGYPPFIEDYFFGGYVYMLPTSENHIEELAQDILFSIAGNCFMKNSDIDDKSYDKHKNIIGISVHKQRYGGYQGKFLRLWTLEHDTTLENHVDMTLCSDNDSGNLRTKCQTFRYKKFFECN